MKKIHTCGNGYLTFVGKRKSRTLLIVLLFAAICNSAMAQQRIDPSRYAPENRNVSSNNSTETYSSIYDFKVPALNGGIIDFAQFKGKKILIVNTKSMEGRDPQFAHLESMYKKYKGQLVIVGFPNDDFGGHPSANNEAMYRKANYNVTFLMAAKVGVKGDKRAPIYVWLTEKKYNHFKDSEVKWDFQKYLINEQGELVDVFDPKVKATSSKVAARVER